MITTLKLSNLNQINLFIQLNQNLLHEFFSKVKLKYKKITEIKSPENQLKTEKVFF
jgi:hypothetical protein